MPSGGPLHFSLWGEVGCSAPSGSGALPQLNLAVGSGPALEPGTSQQHLSDFLHLPVRLWELGPELFLDRE